MDVTYLQVLLGIAIFAILFSIGIGLSIADFRQVIARPRAFIITLACQVVLLPALAILIARVFGLSDVAAFGLLLLAVCPGGVTSNLFTRLAGGFTALSVSLTAVNSMLAVVSIPAVLYVGLELLGSQAAASAQQKQLSSFDSEINEAEARVKQAQARLALAKINLNHTQLQLIYWSRFIRIAKWFVVNENIANKCYLEAYGKIKIIENFTLTARADRIEIYPDSSLNIIDYKTGRLATKKSIISGKNLQLLLEGMIGENGGFYFQRNPQKLGFLKYVQLSGGEDPVAILEIDLMQSSIIIST